MTQAKGGNITLELNAPETVEPGQAVEVVATVHNGALYVNPWEPDRCPGEGGYRVRLDMEGPAGETRSKGPMCVRMVNIGTGTEELRETFSAPDSPGEYSVSANAVLPGSGSETGEETEHLVVSEQEAAEPTDGTDDSDDSDDSDENDDSDGGIPQWLADATTDGGDDNNDSGPLSDPLGMDEAAGQIKIAAGLLLVLVALWVLSPYADLAASGVNAVEGR